MQTAMRTAHLELADQMCFVVHDCQTGACVPNISATKSALSGALVGGLLWPGWATVDAVEPMSTDVLATRAPQAQLLRGGVLTSVDRTSGRRRGNRPGKQPNSPAQRRQLATEERLLRSRTWLDVTAPSAAARSRSIGFRAPSGFDAEAVTQR